MILLDTHVAIWMLLDPARLSSAAKRAINETVSQGKAPRLSSVSLYEIARALERGRIETTLSSAAFLSRLETYTELVHPSAEIAVTAAEFPEEFPSDPIDRIIAATAISEGASLITADQHIRRSRAVKTVW